MCLEWEWGRCSVRGAGLPLTSAAGCRTLSSCWPHTKDGQLVFLGDGVCLPSEAARLARSPLQPTSCPRFVGPLPLTWGAAGAADLILGFVVLLFPVPAGLVLRVVWGLLPGEMEVGGRINQGRLGRAEELERGLSRPPLPLPSPPPPTCTGPSLTSRAWDAARRPQRPRMSGPQARPQGEAAHGRRMAASGPVGQTGGGRGRKVGGLHVLGSGGSNLPSPGPGTGLGLTCPRGPSGRAWPGLQGSSARLRKWEWSKPAFGAGTGSSGSRGSCRNRGRGTGLAAPMQGGRGRPGKHVRAAGPEPGLLPSSEAWPGGEDGRGRLGGEGAAERVDNAQMGL